MFRKFLLHSIPFLVAVLVLIGTVVVPAHAAAFIDSTLHDDPVFTRYSSFLKFECIAYAESGDILHFSMPSVISSYDPDASVDYLIWPPSDYGYHYLRMRMVNTITGHSHPPACCESSSDFVYVKQNFWFDYQDEDDELSIYPGNNFSFSILSFRFEDFVLKLSDTEWGSALFQFNVPAGWTYSVSYDYYFAVPDDGSDYNIISGPHTQSFTRSSKSDVLCTMVRDSDYDYMIEQSADPESYVLFKGATVTLQPPSADKSNEGDLYYYCGYGASLKHYLLSDFYENNKFSFGDVQYVERVVTDFDISSFLLDSVGGFLDAPLLGFFSISDILTVIICVFLLIFVLKILS